MVTITVATELGQDPPVQHRDGLFPVEIGDRIRDVGWRPARDFPLTHAVSVRAACGVVIRQSESRGRCPVSHRL